MNCLVTAVSGRKSKASSGDQFFEIFNGNKDHIPPSLKLTINLKVG